MKNNYLLVFAAVISLFVLACKKDKQDQTPVETPPPVTPYTINVPAGWPTPVIPDFNKETVEGIQLGRSLFYDSILSSNGRSCSTCHSPANSFTVGIHVTPTGESVSIPPLINVAWNPDYGWFGQFPVMDHIPLGDFEPEFFNSNLDSVVARLKRHSYYPQYFYSAFGIKDVASITHDELKEKISFAIIQFVRTISSYNSKFDKVTRHEMFFSPEESDGSNIFYTERGDCYHCHGTPLLTNNLINNNGIDTAFAGRNQGRYLYTSNPNDLGKFSAPSLRNVELTAPYMHDGRFQTLEEVVDYYDSNVHWNSANIDPIMTKPFKRYGLGLTPQEKNDLIAFLKTFTDTSIMSNPSFSKPF